MPAKLPYHPRRTDGNQAEIIGALELAGRRVQDLSRQGGGCPDLLVGTPSGRLVLLEVKMPGAVLNARELAWHLDWVGWPVFVVYDVAYALEVTK